MQFSNTPNFIAKDETWWEKFRAQPHQLFFTSAIFFSIFIMFLSLLSYNGNVAFDFALVHGFGLNYTVFTNAFLGFLITVIPKYNGLPAIKEEQYIKPWIVFQVAVFVALFISVLIGKILISLVMLYFSYVFYDFIKRSAAIEKKDSILITSIFVFGAILLSVEAIFSINLSEFIFFSYLLNLVLIVALRMVPSFYFILTREETWNKPKYIRETSILLLLLIGISMQFDFTLFLKIVSFIALVFYTYVVVKLNFYKQTPAILSVLTYSFFWLVIGFLFLFIESVFEMSSFKLSFHVFAIGFVTTLLIGFGSRVSLGHAIPARPIVADKLTIFLFVFVQVVLLFRIFTSVGFILNLEYFIQIFYISSFAWIFLFVVWTLRYGKLLLRV